MAKTNIGEEGTEQFTITTRVNGKRIQEQPIHDPFVRSTTTLKGLWHAWRALFGGIKVEISVDGTHGAQRAIMNLDPVQLQHETEQWLADMPIPTTGGYYAAVREAKHG